MKFIVLVAVATLAVAFAGCPNKCSGHGKCTLGDLCECQPRWVGVDCAERECSYGLSWVTSADTSNAPSGSTAIVAEGTMPQDAWFAPGDGLRPEGVCQGRATAGGLPACAEEGRQGSGTDTLCLADNSAGSGTNGAGCTWLDTDTGRPAVTSVGSARTGSDTATGLDTVAAGLAAAFGGVEGWTIQGKDGEGEILSLSGTAIVTHPAGVVDAGSYYLIPPPGRRGSAVVPIETQHYDLGNLVGKYIQFMGGQAAGTKRRRDKDITVTGADGVWSQRFRIVSAHAPVSTSDSSTNLLNASAATNDSGGTLLTLTGAGGHGTAGSAGFYTHGKIFTAAQPDGISIKYDISTGSDSTVATYANINGSASDDTKFTIPALVQLDDSFDDWASQFRWPNTGVNQCEPAATQAACEGAVIPGVWESGCKASAGGSAVACTLTYTLGSEMDSPDACEAKIGCVYTKAKSKASQYQKGTAYRITTHTGGGTGKHAYSECSDKGVCDRGSGECTCFDGYEGRGCRRQTCPNECSAHGRCLYNNQVDPLYGPNAAHPNELESQYWDHNMARQCTCDRGWEGYDCSQRICPKGDDPMTDCDMTGGAVADIQQLNFADSANLQTGGFFTLSFTDMFGGDYTTKPIWLTTHNSETTPFAKASTVVSIHTNIESALEELPNFVVPNVTVTNKSGSGNTDHQYEVTFVDTANSGQQNLLVCSDISAVGDQKYDHPAMQPRFRDMPMGDRCKVTNENQCNDDNGSAPTRCAQSARQGTTEAVCEGSSPPSPAGDFDGDGSTNVCEWVAADTVPPGGTVNFDLSECIPANVFKTGDSVYAADGTKVGEVASMVAAVGYSGRPRIVVATNAGGASWTLPVGDTYIYADPERQEASEGPLCTAKHVAHDYYPMDGVSTVSTVQHRYQEHVECSNRGTCDTGSGLCACFEGFTGEACAQQTVFF